MKIKLQKMLAMLIIALLILPMLTTTANAYEYSDVMNENTRDVLKILSTYGLMQGYDSYNFRPGNCVTRAEIAKISIVLLGYDDFTIGMESSYSDMKGHWAERYVELINELNIIKGNDENNTYEPNKYMSYTEAIIAILKVIGYKDMGLSDDAYMSLAKDLGLLNNINNPSAHYITRESLAFLIYNALTISTVEMKNANITYTGKILFDNIGRKASEKIDDQFAIKHSYIDLKDYMLNVCTVYYDTKGKILLVEKPLYKTVEGNVATAVSTNVVFLSDKYSNKTKYNLYGVPAVFNGIKAKITNEDFKNSYLKLVMDNNSDIIIGAVVYKITDRVVIDANSLYKAGDESFAGKSLPRVNGKVSLENVKVIGEVTDIYDIQEDDLVYFYETKENKNNKSTLMIEVIRKSVVGKYEDRGMIAYEDIFTINSKNYRLSSNFMDGDKLAVGDTIKAILNEDGKIVKVKVIDYIKEPEQYGYITSIKNNNTNRLPIISIINKQGKLKNYKLRENSGEVSKEMIFKTSLYSTSLAEGDFIKYDLYDADSIKIVKKINDFNISGDYDNKADKFSKQNGTVNSNTTIVELNNNNYEKINKNRLGNYLEGKVVLNSYGVAEMLVLNENYTKTTDSTIFSQTDPVVTPVNNKFSGSIYGAIQTISNNNGVEKLKLFNTKATYTVDKNLNKDLRNFNNQFVKLEISKDIVVGITSYSAEISKSKVTAIYSEQMQIDGISFVEYSKNALVFACGYDSSGNITSFSEASLSDIKINSILKFYNINKNYNGVMDIIIICK